MVLRFPSSLMSSDINCMKRLLNGNTSSFFKFYSSKTPVNQRNLFHILTLADVIEVVDKQKQSLWIVICESLGQFVRERQQYHGIL